MGRAALTALRPGRRAASTLVRLGSATALVLTAHSLVNLRLLRRPPANPGPVLEAVSVLLPVRNEAGRVGASVPAVVSALDLCPRAEFLVLDDGSTDGTMSAVREASDDPRVRTLSGVPLPPGWLGKPHACAQLAAAASPDSTAYVFLDADVVVAPHAFAASLAMMRDSGLDLVCPYPRQVAAGVPERLVQPLLQWSWLTTLPLRIAERSSRPSLSAANGQLLVVDATAYRRAGGHAAVRRDVLDDLALLRAVKRAGGRGGVVDGTRLASCRMYDGWPALRDGYAKSLWAAFGTPAGAMGVAAFLALAYLLPPAAAILGSRAGVLGYLAAVAGRTAVASRTGGRVFPDPLAHPASIGVFLWLTRTSWRRRRQGTLTWKGRSL